MKPETLKRLIEVVHNVRVGKAPAADLTEVEDRLKYELDHRREDDRELLTLLKGGGAA